MIRSLRSFTGADFCSSKRILGQGWTKCSDPSKNNTWMDKILSEFVWWICTPSLDWRCSMFRCIHHPGNICRRTCRWQRKLQSSFFLTSSSPFSILPPCRPISFLFLSTLTLLSLILFPFCLPKRSIKWKEILLLFWSFLDEFFLSRLPSHHFLTVSFLS